MGEKNSLRSLVGLLILCASLVCSTAISPPPPTPPPTPAPVAAMPAVLVYPFDVQTGADVRLGMAIAQILAQEMTAAGGIAVLPVPQGVKRADFLNNAQTVHADFYISGYVVPVGDSARVVEQVVSVESGVILFSQTAQVSSVADVASQSLTARAEILSFLGRGTENVQQQSSTPAPTSTNGAQMPIQGIGSIVNSVFKHHGNGSHSATAAPVVKPSRGVIVAPVTASGVVLPADLTYALHELYYAVNTRYNAQMTALTTSVAQSADAICGSNRDNTIATGTLQEVPAHHGKTYTFDLMVYTCFGAALDHETGKGSSIKSAVDAAVTAYGTTHPENS